MSCRDGHVRVLPLHVANKIAAGEVVERPASVVKELVENALDAGARSIRISISQGGRKLVSVQDDGCGMSREDAVLSLERQATSKILDVDDIEQIDTLGFRGEAIPSIASVSRFSITTRRADSDEGTLVVVNAGTLAEVSSAGCPPGTLVEVRDLFCNVPARRKFLRSYATEEAHVKTVFTTHALAHPKVAFTLLVDGRETYRLASATCAADRLRDLFGPDFLADMLALPAAEGRPVSVTGFIERPNLSTSSRRDQYVFVNGRPATSASIAYALREAYPRRAGDARPAAVLFLELPPEQVDVNVHPTKREVRFRDNIAVKQAIVKAIGAVLSPTLQLATPTPTPNSQPPTLRLATPTPTPTPTCNSSNPVPDVQIPAQPVAMEFAIEPDSTQSKPWKWFSYLAETASGYLLVETDAGLVTINPQAARERIAYEALLKGLSGAAVASQVLLIPETVQLPPVDAARIRNALNTILAMGFQLEEFGRDTFKIEAIPQLLGAVSPATILSTIARDLAEGGMRRDGLRWREELIAKSVARSYAGVNVRLTPEGAAKLVEELCACSMPYVCPRGKPVMIFTSTRELNRKFSRE